MPEQRGHEVNHVGRQKRCFDDISKAVTLQKKGRLGIGFSDQLLAYFQRLRRSIKWYGKVAFKLISRTLIVNSYLIYKKNCAVAILQFHESLVRSLVLGISLDKLKPE